MENLTIIGTSHIAKQSIKDIKLAFEAKPDIVALELDAKRLYALTHKGKNKGMPNISRIGIRGFLFSLVARWVQNKLGEQVGVSPGDEMLTAVKLARKNKTKIALIDQDIEITLKRFSQALTWKEKFRILGDVIRSFLFKDNELKKLGIKTLDLSKVPSKKLIKRLLMEVRERYPNIYMVLVEERNIIMAHNLNNLMQNNPDKKILAIVGAGHEDEILRLIKDNTINYSFNINF